MEPMNELVIDVDKICQELRIRPEIYIKITVSFAATLNEKLKTLNEALSTNDADLMRMILHEIKGTAGNLRLKNISEPEAVMHAAVKEGETQKNLEICFERLKVESERLQQWAYKNRPS